MKRTLLQLRTEILALKTLRHPNILELLQVELNAVYVKKSGLQVGVWCDYMCVHVCVWDRGAWAGCVGFVYDSLHRRVLSVYMDGPTHPTPTDTPTHPRT